MRLSRAALGLCFVVMACDGARRPASQSVATPPKVAPPPSLAGPEQDLTAIVDRVHFAYHPDNTGFSGGHSTYASRVEPDGTISVQPVRPAAAAAGRPSKGTLGAPVTLATVRIGGAAADRAHVVTAPEGSVRIERAGSVEEVRNRDEGVEQSWRFAERPAGEALEIRVALGGQRFVAATATGLHFDDPKTGLGVRYGVATWVDAAGRRTRVQPRWKKGEIVLTVPAEVVAASTFPAVLDPYLTPEQGIDGVYAGPGDTQVAPSITADGTNYLVVWSDTRSHFGSGMGGDIIGARVRASDGALLDPYGILIAAIDYRGEINPSACWTGSNFFVVWSEVEPYDGDQYRIYGTRVTTAGAVLDNPARLIGDVATEGDQPSCVSNGSTIMVAYRNHYYDTQLYINKLDLNGNSQCSDTLIPNASLVGTPRVATSGVDTYLVVWANSANTIEAYDTSCSNGNRFTMPSLPCTWGKGQPDVRRDGTNGNNLVVWSEWHGCLNNQGQRVWGARVNGGAILDANGIGIVDGPSLPRLFSNGTNYLVAFQAGTQIWAKRVAGATGAVDANPFVVTTAGLYPAVWYTGSYWGVAYQGLSSPTPVKITRVDNNATVIDPSGIAASTGHNSERWPSIAYDGTNYLVVWADDRNSATTGYDIYGARVSPTGTVLDPNGFPIANVAGNQTHPYVRLLGANYLVTYADDRSGSAIYGMRVRPTDGALLDAAGGFVIDSGGGDTRYNPAAAKMGSTALVVWGQPPTGVRGTLVQDTGAVGASFTIAAGSSATGPSVRTNGTRYLVVWSDTRSGIDVIYGARVEPNGALLDGAPNAAINVSGDNGFYVQTSPFVASMNGEWLVAWPTWDSADWWGLFAQRLDNNGALVGSPVTVVPFSEMRTSTPSITTDGLNYAVAWQQFFPVDTGEQTMVNRVSPTGTVLDGAGMLVSGSTPIELGRAAVEAGPTGRVMIAYPKFDKTPGVNTVHLKSRFLLNLPNGTACDPQGGAGACNSGICVSGVCCQQACPNTAGVASTSCINNGTTCAVASCTSGLADCNGTYADGCEVNLNTDADHCGACPNACSGNHMATRTCASGVCNGTCAGGFADCNGNKLTDGCEIDTTSDPNHCGACPNVCSSNNMATRTCAASVCNGTCNAGFADCNVNKLTDGCEINLGTNVDNCGGCGRACSASNVNARSCASGLCNSTCATGFGNCSQPAAPSADNGCETDTRLNGNCGACGVTCNSTSCTTGVCQVVAGNGSCVTVDNSACQTPFCQGSGNGCGWVDSDGDGLSDPWESHGYVDLNCNGVNDGAAVDIQLPGANPNVPDLFIYYNYMVGAHSHQPTQAALDQVTQAFALHGITLHLVNGGSIPETTVTTLTGSPNPACTGGSVTTMSALRAAYFGNRQAAYRYLVFAHQVETLDASHQLFCARDSFCNALPAVDLTGIADLPGDDLIVSFGYIMDHGSTCTVPADCSSGTCTGGECQADIHLQAATIMHELGHTLGLRHGGPDYCVIDKPNYISVMNPRSYQLDAIPVGPAPGVVDYRYCAGDADCGPPTVPSGACATPNACHCTVGQAAVIGFDYCYRVDYSNVSLISLNESASSCDANFENCQSGGLDETVGVGGPAGDEDLVYYYVPGPSRQAGASNGSPIDWNNLHNTSAGRVRADINNDGDWTGLTTWNDWQNLSLAFQCTGGYGAGGSAYWFTSELSPQEAAAANSRYPTEKVTIDVRPGCGGNWIVIGSSLTVPVVLYGSATFDVSTVNQPTLRLAGAQPTQVVMGDVNSDGRPDLTLTFVMSSLQVNGSTTSVTLSGARTNGQSIQGSDTITIVPSAGPVVNTHNDGSGYAISIVGSLNNTWVGYALNNGVDSVTDRCGNTLTINNVGNIFKMTCDETTGGGMQILSPSTFQVRRKKTNANGRVYTIWFTATDGSGNATTASFKAQVKKAANDPNAIDDGVVECIGQCP
jgi:hypothetical protein